MSIAINTLLRSSSSFSLIPDHLQSGVAHAVQLAQQHCADEEGPEWHASLEEVYSALKDPAAPDSVRSDAARRCWAIAEHGDRAREMQRQLAVASYGEFPFVHGLLVGLVEGYGPGQVAGADYGPPVGEETRWGLPRCRTDTTTHTRTHTPNPS